MRHMPEKPIPPERQDRNETLAFFGTLIAGAVFLMALINATDIDDGLLKRLLEAVAIFGPGIMGSYIKTTMEKEYSYKVRDWTDYWRDYEEETRTVERELLKEDDPYMKKILRDKLDARKRFIMDHYY